MGPTRFALVAAIVLAACGGSADEPDAPTPTHPDATSPGSVRVRVLDFGEPVSGVTVMFHDPGGAVVRQAVTGADGRAGADLDAGGTATLLTDLDGRRRRISITALVPGDEAVVVLAAPRPTGVSTVLVDLPGAVTGADAYAIYACHESSSKEVPTPTALGIESTCLDPAGTFQVTAVAERDGRPIAQTSLDRIPPDPTGTATIALPAWSTAFWTVDATIRSLPADVTGRFATAQLVHHGLALPGDSVVGDATSLRLAPVPTDDEYLLDAMFGAHWLAGAGGNVVYGMRRMPVTHDLDLDAAELLPRLGAISIDLATPGTPIDVDLPAAVATADALIVEIGWNDGDDAWTVIAPPDVALPLRLPDLSTGPAWPPVGAGFVSATVYDWDAVAGYAAFRREPLRFTALLGDERSLRISQSWGANDDARR